MRHCVDPLWILKLMPNEREFIARQFKIYRLPTNEAAVVTFYDTLSRRMHIGQLIQFLGKDYSRALRDELGAPVPPEKVCLALWLALCNKWFDIPIDPQGEIPGFWRHH